MWLEADDHLALIDLFFLNRDVVNSVEISADLLEGMLNTDCTYAGGY
jgi:hypothetical protein